MSEEQERTSQGSCVGSKTKKTPVPANNPVTVPSTECIGKPSPGQPHPVLTEHKEPHPWAATVCSATAWLMECQPWLWPLQSVSFRGRFWEALATTMTTATWLSCMHHCKVHFLSQLGGWRTFRKKIIHVLFFSKPLLRKIWNSAASPSWPR